MTVTSFAFLKLLSDSILPPEFLEKIDKVIDSQDAIIADQQSATKEPDGSAQQRPVGFFQQVEDSGFALGTSEWPSISIFEAWRNRPSGKVAITDLATHVANDGKPIGYVVAEGSYFGPTTQGSGRVSLLEAEHIEFSRWLVPPSKRAEFDSMFDRLRSHRMKLDQHHIVCGSWCLDFVSQPPKAHNLSEFVMVAGCNTPWRVGARSVEDSSDNSFPEALLKEMATSFEIKHYTKCV
ncbi:Fc.00g048380.m01.CDS01 [Cosmosporella sp. VM-42]